MPKGFSYITLSQARSALAGRLQDPGCVYWSASELNSILYEALRTRQALTAFYKDRIAFPSVAGQSYYDLSVVGNTVQGPNSPTTYFGYSVTDVDIAQLILLHLLEPPLVPGTVWTGTGQFTFPQLVSAVQNRLTRFLGESGCVVSTSTVPINAGPPIPEVYLPNVTIDVRRATWVNIAGKHTVLWRSDEWAMNSFLPDRLQTPADPPRAYSVFNSPPIGMQLAPPPLNSGSLDLLTINSGVTVALNPQNPVILQVPDDLCWAIKWGAMADLLNSDGPCRDYERAKYCEQRYQEGVQVARLLPSTSLGMVNNKQANTGSVFELDAFLPSWQSNTGKPYFFGMCGRNIACVGSTPNGVYGLSLDMAVNIPMPMGDGSYLQIGQDYISGLLDYAQHVASFKMGGTEFTGTSRLLNSFISSAKVQNDKLASIAFYSIPIMQASGVDEVQVLRM